MKNLPTLRNDSSFVVQFSNSVSKTRAILLFTIKIVKMFELHASIPLMPEGGGKRRGLGPRNDVLATCKAVTPRGDQRVKVFFPH